MWVILEPECMLSYHQARCSTEEQQIVSETLFFPFVLKATDALSRKFGNKKYLGK